MQICGYVQGGEEGEQKRGRQGWEVRLVWIDIGWKS